MNNTLGKTSRTKKCQKYLEEYVDIIKNIIQEGMEQGIFIEGDAQGIAYGILGVSFSSLLYRIKKEGVVTPEQIYKSYIEIVIRGITKA